MIVDIPSLGKVKVSWLYEKKDVERRIKFDVQTGKGPLALEMVFTERDVEVTTCYMIHFTEEKLTVEEALNRAIVTHTVTRTLEDPNVKEIARFTSFTKMVERMFPERGNALTAAANKRNRKLLYVAYDLMKAGRGWKHNKQIRKKKKQKVVIELPQDTVS